MAVTLKRVATEAGVSLATASRAFGAPHLLATETRHRVIEAAVKLGYSLPAALRARTFAVIVPDIANPIYAAQIKILQDLAWPGRHRMVLAHTGESPSRELEFLEALGQEMDGILLCSPRGDAEDARRAVGATPLVIHNGHSAGLPVVIMDVEPGLRQALEHLQSLGHERLAYVPGPATSWANTTRLNILQRVSHERGMSLSVVGNQSADIQGGVAAAAAVIASGATAVIAYNDFVAIGLQSGIRGLGGAYGVPLSIVGIDDVEFAAAVVPALTTVRMDFGRSAGLSFEILMKLIEGTPPTSGTAVRFGSQLIVRGSTSPARASATQDAVTS